MPHAAWQASPAPTATLKLRYPRVADPCPLRGEPLIGFRDLVILSCGYHATVRDQIPAWLRARSPALTPPQVPGCEALRPAGRLISVLSR